MNRRRARFTLFAIMLVTMLGTAGIALPYPVLAPYFLEAQANGLNRFLAIHPKLLLGFALAVYPLGLLLGSTFIGAVSDLYGRKRVLLITIGGSILGYLLTGTAVVMESYPLFIAARLTTGICEGNISIARALAVELHPVIDRTRAMSLVYATISIGWLVGPLAGGYLMPLGTHTVFLAAAGAMLLCALVVFAAISGENNSAKKGETANDGEPGGLWQLMIAKNSLGLLRHREIQPMFRFYLLYTMGINAFYEFYPVWFVEKLAADSKTIAWATVALTATMTIMSALGTSPIAKRLGQYRSLILSTFLLGLLLFIQPLASRLVTYPIFMLIGAVIAMGNGIVPAYLSEHFGHLGEGRVMGLQTTIFCLSNVIIAIAGSLIAVLSTNLALWIGAAMVSGASFRLWLSQSRSTTSGSGPMTAQTQLEAR